MIAFADVQAHDPDGVVSVEAFPRLLSHAIRVVHFATFGRTENEDALSSQDRQTVKELLVALVLSKAQAEKQDQEAGEHPPVASEHIGSYSVTYEKRGEETRCGALSAKEWHLVRLYLAHTGLLYRGVGR